MQKYFKLFLIVLPVFLVFNTLANSILSPDKNIEIRLDLKGKIYYSVYFKGQRVLDPSPLSMETDVRHFGVNPVIEREEKENVNNRIGLPYGLSNSYDETYNKWVINFAGGYAVEFRAYNHGVAYRFISKLPNKKITIKNEEVAYRFGFDINAWLPDSKSYETNYVFHSLNKDVNPDFGNFSVRDKIFLPIVVEPVKNIKLLITEANLYDYPSLFLSRGNDYENFFVSQFEKVALETETGGFSNYFEFATKEANYIAQTNGSRNFPWRAMIITDDDKVLVDCNLVYLLSDPSEMKETSWIKPGKVAWDWWHDYVVEGQNYRGGVNTQTYLYQIDFASKFQIEYVIIDWLWTDKYDLTLFNPDVDIKKIVEYGNSKNVKVIVWCPSHTLHRQLNKALDLFAAYGVAGVKTDFFAREDQTGIRMYEDIAKAAAERKLLVDFHGCTKPTGLSRKYPNVINYEAVLGNEYNKLVDKVTVDHKVILPFIRTQQGPMDFTPGGMRNMQSGHNIRFTLPVVNGTRCNEMALYVIYYEPLKMFCDAPSYYDKEPELTKFISNIPTVWDESITLEASIGKHLLVARRKGADWYVAGITGKQPKESQIKLDFLPKGNYQAKILKDGPNSDRVGTDYLFEEASLNSTSSINVNMVSGGGFIMKLVKQ